MFHQPQVKRRFALETFKTRSKSKRPLALDKIKQKREKLIQLLLYTLAFTFILSLESFYDLFFTIEISKESSTTNPGLLFSFLGKNVFFQMLSHFFFCLFVNTLWAWIMIVHFPQVLRNKRHLTLIYLILLSTLFCSKLVVLYHLSPFLIPLGLMAYLFGLVFAPSFALALLPFLSLYIAYTFYSAYGVEHTLEQLLSSFRVSCALLFGVLVMIALCKQVTKRNKLTLTGVALGGAHFLCLSLFYTLGTPTPETSVFLQEVFYGVASGVLTGLFLSGFLPFLESWFDFITDISLLELSVGTNPLLEKMLLEAPGTFHHSMMVGILAEAAADSIGARSLLARVGAYYHDIGKLVRPEYFTENATYQKSKHEALTPLLSTLIILAHVKDGAELGKLYSLPTSIREIIVQHQGCSVVQYFYVEALKDPQYREDFPEHKEKENKEFFRYPGPKPQSKEAAIVFIADSIEAASRSLSDPSPAKLEALINKIVYSKLIDQQLEDCDLTFKELNSIKTSLLNILISLFHTRVKYPEAPKLV
jgi:putative nucleotidyltransferase with HDIG domain